MDKRYKTKQYFIDKLSKHMINDTIIDLIPNKNGSFHNCTVKYKHNKCGLESTNSIITINKSKSKEFCNYCFSHSKESNSKESFLSKFNSRADANEYEFLTEFKSLREMITVKHSCGYIYNTKAMYLIHFNTKCPKCNHKILCNTKDIIIKKIKEADINNEYSILYVYKKNGKYCIKSKVKLKHKACGSVFVITAHNFISNDRRCHECNKKKMKEQLKQLDKVHSKMSDFIDNELSKNDIVFEREKRFDDLKNIRCLPLDFYFVLNDKKYAIEYDGKEHFEYNKSSTIFTKEAFEKIQLRDKIKTDYCSSHNIELIRFSYKDTKDFISEKIYNLKNSSETIESITDKKNISK